MTNSINKSINKRKKLRNGKVLVNGVYKTPIFNMYTNEFVGYHYVEGKRPHINDVYIGFYDLLPKCPRGLKWICYGIQGWHICVRN